MGMLFMPRTMVRVFLRKNSKDSLGRTLKAPKIFLKKVLKEPSVLPLQLSNSPRNLQYEHFHCTILRLDPDFVIVHVMANRQLTSAVARGATAQAPFDQVLL